MEDTTPDAMTDATPDVTPDATPDTGEQPVDQCLNDDDLAILLGGEVDATGEATTCGLGCLGDDDPGACSGACVADATGLSAGCSGCYANTVVCSIQNCLAPCSADPSSEACTTCQTDAGCIDDFNACTGEIPEPPPVSACMNAEDLGILQGGDVDATGEATTCGLGCLGDDDPGACSGACVETATGLSTDCSSCYANTVVCSIQNCLAPCSADPSSEACTTCQVDAGCIDAFDNCTGPVDSLEGVLIGDGRFGTLVTAVGVAGIDLGDLEADPITIFAPVDAAFAAIPEDDLNAILADTELLTSILTYHVLPVEADSTVVVGADTHTTLQGSDITVTVDGDTVMINEATILEVDIAADNGIIHAIDGVLTPPAAD